MEPGVRALPSYRARIARVTPDTAKLLYARWFENNREGLARLAVQNPSTRAAYRGGPKFTLDPSERRRKTALYDAQPPEYWTRLDRDRATLSGADSDVADNVRQLIKETLIWTRERPYMQWIAFVELVSEPPEADLMYAMVLSIEAPFKILEVNYMSIFFQGIQHGYRFPGSYQRGPDMVTTVFREAIQYVRDRVRDRAAEAADSPGSLWHGARVRYVAITPASEGSRRVLRKLGLEDQLKDAYDYVDTIGPTEEADYFNFPPMWYRLCERCSRAAKWTWEGRAHLDVAFCGAACSAEHATNA